MGPKDGVSLKDDGGEAFLRSLGLRKTPKPEGSRISVKSDLHLSQKVKITFGIA